MNYGKIDNERQESLASEINLSHLTVNERESIREKLTQFADIFHLPGDKLTYTDIVSHNIPIAKDVSPIYVKQYRLPEAQKPIIKEKIEQMLRDDIIQESKSPWNSPMLLVKKKSETGEPNWRLVIDYRKLNEASIEDRFPIPNITEILDQLGNTKYFSALDLASGYHQFLMDERDREKTTFSTGSNHYEWKRMRMGLKNSSGTCQRAVNYILKGLIGKDCFIYLDYIKQESKGRDKYVRKMPEE